MPTSLPALARCIRSVRSALLITILASACGAQTPTGLGAACDPPRQPAIGARRVLFIGNSLTYVNDLPTVVSDLGRQSGDPIDVCMVAFPDFNLDDHWAEGTALKALQGAPWDVVVMQQGPSSLPENQLQLAASVERLAPLIRAAGATPALYMVWPSVQRSGDFDRVRDSYAKAAERVQGIFIPAGEAWRTAWARDPSIALYGPDGFHPSALGTLTAALVAYEKIVGKSCVGLAAPASIGGANLSVSPALLRLLQDAAHETADR